MFKDLFEVAMECEIGFSDFWDMTLGEILILITAYKRKRERELKERALMDYKLAQAIALNINLILSKDAKEVPFTEIYKELFEDECRKSEERLKEEQAKLQKERMLEFAKWHNSRRKEVE